MADCDFLKTCRNFKFGKHGPYCSSYRICYRKYCHSDLFGTYLHENGRIVLIKGFRYNLSV